MSMTNEMYNNVKSCLQDDIKDLEGEQVYLTEQLKYVQLKLQGKRKSMEELIYTQEVLYGKQNQNSLTNGL